MSEKSGMISVGSFKEKLQGGRLLREQRGERRVAKIAGSAGSPQVPITLAPPSLVPAVVKSPA